MALTHPVARDRQAEALDDGRQPEAHAIDAGDRAEIDEGERQDPRVGEAGQRARRRDMLAPLVLEGETPLQPAAALRVEPGRVRRAVGQVEKGDDGEHDRGQGLDDEEPLPAAQARRPIEAEQPGGNRRTHRRRQRDRRHEIADDARPIGGRKPQCQEKDDAGEEPGLGEAEQDPQEVERVFGAEAGRPGDLRDERHGAGDEAPGQHDPRDPAAGADLVENDVRRHLEQEIGEEEHARAETEGSFRKVEVGVHRELGEADVHPVEIGDEIAEDEERDEPPRDFRKRPLFHVVRHGMLPWAAPGLAPGSPAV